MHLVVLRRNDVELPITLPASLMPYTPASSEPFASDLGAELQADRSPSPAPLIQQWPSSTAGTAASTTGAQQPNNTAGDSAANQWSTHHHHDNQVCLSGCLCLCVSHGKASITETLDLCQLPRPPYEIHKMINLPASVKIFKNKLRN